MRTILEFDKIERLGNSIEAEQLQKYKSQKSKYKTYKRYFADMGIPEDKKDARIVLAEDLEDLMLAFFIFCEMQRSIYGPDVQYQKQYLYERYRNIVYDHIDDKDGLLDKDDYIDEFIRERTEDIVDVTNNNLDKLKNRKKSSVSNDDEKHTRDDWWLSKDRAWVIGAEDANSIENYEDFEEALNLGYTMKEWCDVRDDKERESHLAVGGKIIPISDPFMVGDSLMMFPKDTSFGAGPEEISNCRCYLRFL